LGKIFAFVLALKECPQKLPFFICQGQFLNFISGVHLHDTHEKILLVSSLSIETKKDLGQRCIQKFGN
jgi:hypothetical protein